MNLNTRFVSYLLFICLVFTFLSQSHAIARPSQNRIRNNQHANKNRPKARQQPPQYQQQQKTPPQSNPLNPKKPIDPNLKRDNAYKSTPPADSSSNSQQQHGNNYKEVPGTENVPRTGDLPPSDEVIQTSTTPSTPQPSQKGSKLSVDTITTGAWTHGQKNFEKAQLWSEQSSVAQAIGVDMISTIVVPMSMYIMPVGYQGEGHLGLTIPEPVWKHWAAGSSVSRYEKITHGPKMPIYNSHSGNNALVTDSDRLVDHGFFADVVYDFQIDILPCLKEITDSILYVYRTLHRFEVASKHSGLINGRESSPHMYFEPKILTHLLQTLYISASDFITNLSTSYTLTIMNPKRNWIIESLTLNDQLDKVLYDLLKSAEKNAVQSASASASTPQSTTTTNSTTNSTTTTTPSPPELDTNKLHQQHFSIPPFHGYRTGLSLTEMFSAHQYQVGDWSGSILQLISDEVNRIDKRLDIESSHISKETSTTQSPWQSMSLFDYLDEKIMLYATKRDNKDDESKDNHTKSKKNSHGGASFDAIDVESIFGRNIKQSPTAWLDRLEEALIYISETSDTDASLSNHAEVIPKSSPTEQPSKKSTDPSNLSRLDRTLDPLSRRHQRGRDQEGRLGKGHLPPPDVAQNRRSYNKSTIKLVSSLTVAHQHDQTKLNEGVKKVQNSSNQNSNAMVRGTFTQLSVEQHEQYKSLLKTWGARVRTVFRQFGQYLSEGNKSQNSDTLKSKQEGNEHSDDIWLQGMTPAQHFSLLSHIFPTQLALQSYQTSNALGIVDDKIKKPEDWNSNTFRSLTGQLPPLYHQSCLTETYIGSNRTAIIDLSAGPFSWGGGKGNSGDYGIGYSLNTLGSRSSTKTATALPNADHLANIRSSPGQTSYVTTDRNEIVMKYYDIQGLKGVKFDYNSVLKMDQAAQATQSQAQAQSVPSNTATQTNTQQSDTNSPLNTVPQSINLAQYNLSQDVTPNTHHQDIQTTDSDIDVDADSDVNIVSPIAQAPLSVNENAMNASEFSLSFDIIDKLIDTVDTIDSNGDGDGDVESNSEIDITEFQTFTEMDEYLFDLPSSTLINDDDDSSDDKFTVHTQFIPDQITSDDFIASDEKEKEIPSINDETIQIGQKQQNFILQRNPFLRSNRRRATLRKTQTDTVPNGENTDTMHTGRGTDAAATKSIDATTSPYSNPPNPATPPSHSTKSQLMQDALEGLTKGGDAAPFDTTIPPPLERQGAVHPSNISETVQEMLKRAGFDPDALKNIGTMPDSMIKGPNTKSSTNNTSEQEQKDKAALEHDVISHILDSIEKDEKEHAQQQQTIGDDTKLDENTIVHTDAINDLIEKTKHKYDAVDDSVKRTNRINTNKNNNKSNKNSVVPDTHHTAQQLENELLMLEQLLQSDMCSQKLLDCSKYQSEYDTLQRVYRREVIDNQLFPSDGTTSVNPDGNVDFEKDTSASSNARQFFDTEIPLRLQDGLQDVELGDLNLNGKDNNAGRHSETIDYDVYDTLLNQINGNVNGTSSNNSNDNKKNDHSQDKPTGPVDIIDRSDIDVDLGSTTDAALGTNTLNSHDRLQSVFDAMPAANDKKTPEQLQRALHFGGHDAINGGFSLSAIDYYMSHVNSAINNYISTAILQPMELSGVDKLYYRRVHFSLFLLVDHDDFNPLDLYNIPYVDLKGSSGNNNQQTNVDPDLDGYQFGPNWKGFPYPPSASSQKRDKEAKDQAAQHQNNQNKNQPTPGTNSTMSQFMTDFNVNMWQVLQLAIEQVRIRGQQFSYNVVPINIYDDVQVYTTIEQALTTTVTPSYYSNPLYPQSFTHTYINTDILIKQLINSLVSAQSQPLPRNTRHIPIVMLSLATRSQPVLLDIYHQAVVKSGIVIAIQTPHSPTTTSVIVNNFSASQSPLTNIFTPHTPQCNDGYKMYMDPRDPTSAILYSTLSLLFSTNAPSYGLFVYPHNSPLSLSLPRTTIDAYQRNYLLTAIRTTTKIANLATYTLSLINSDVINSCILDEIYTQADATYRHPYIFEWKDKKLYKLVRKAQRSVRYHLFMMREYVSNLDMENGVKYIRTVVGSAWQYRHLVDTLLIRMDKCSYYSAYQARKDQGVDLTDMDTYGVYFNPAAIANSFTSLIGYENYFEDNTRQPLADAQTRSSWSILNKSSSFGRRGIGIYLWLVAICIIIGLFLFRAVNDVVVIVQTKKQD